MTIKLPLPPSFETAYTVAKVAIMRHFKDDHFFDDNELFDFLSEYFDWKGAPVDICIEGLLDQMEYRGFLYMNPYVDMYEMNERVPKSQTFYMVCERPVASEFGTIFTPSYANGRVVISNSKHSAVSSASGLARLYPHMEYDIFTCAATNK